MFSSTKPSTVIYIMRNAIIAYTKDAEIAHIDLPPQAVKNLEVTSPEGLTAVLGDFFGKNNLRGKKILIVLDDSIVFHKIVAAEEGLNTQAVYDDFMGKVPLPTDTCRIIGLTGPQQFRLYATNKMLYQIAGNVLAGLGKKVIGVTPALIYGLVESRKPNKIEVTRFFDKQPLLAKANFQEAT